MSKSLFEQFRYRCIHFNGVQNGQCEKGISYEDVTGENRLKIPCLNTGGHCTHCEFPSDEEARKKVEEVEARGDRLKKALALKKEIREEHGNQYGTGTKPCPNCGGTISYRYYGQENGQVHMACDNDNCVNFME